MIAQHSLAQPLTGSSRPVTAKLAADETLVGLIAVGDRHAMRALFVRHHVRVFRFVLCKVADPALAEDLVSEVFLEVWRNAQKFEARATVSTWLLAIARFKALSALRRRTLHGGIDEALGVEDASENPEVAAEIKDRDEILRVCLKGLSPSHREILSLVYYHGKSIEALARIVGAPLNTIKTRMFYARKHLGALLLAAGVDRTSF